MKAQQTGWSGAIVAVLATTVVAVSLAGPGGTGPENTAPAGPVPGSAAVTYQGQLKQGGVPVNNASCEFRFTVWDSSSGGQPSPYPGVHISPVAVANGLFTAELNADLLFGPPGNPVDPSMWEIFRWLEVEVSCPAGGVLVPLVPRRQAITSSPRSLNSWWSMESMQADYAMSAGSVPWSGLAGVPEGFADNTDNDLLGDVPVDLPGEGILKWSGSYWLAADDTDTLNNLSCADGQIAKWNTTASQWECGPDVDTDTDTLGGLSCADGLVLKSVAGTWGCATDDDTDTDTPGALSCADGQVAKRNGAAWARAADVAEATAPTHKPFGDETTIGKTPTFFGTILTRTFSLLFR